MTMFAEFDLLDQRASDRLMLRTAEIVGLPQ